MARHGADTAPRARRNRVRGRQSRRLDVPLPHPRPPGGRDDEHHPRNVRSAMPRRASLVLSAIVVVTAFAAHAARPSGDAKQGAALPRLRRLPFSDARSEHDRAEPRKSAPSSSINADARKDHAMNPSTTEFTKFAMNRRAMLTLLAGATAGIISTSSRAAVESKPVTLYKDPQCGCCEGYADYLRSNGFAVSIVPTHDLPLLDEKYGIPTELSPCHISLIGGYFVGGHVPIEVVKRLLSRKPPITGLTLPVIAL